MPVRLAATELERATVSLSSPVVEPVRDDRLDTVTITARAYSSSGGAVPVSGTATVRRGGAIVLSWALRSSGAQSFVWDGRVGGRILPGRYSVTVAERGPEGPVRSATTALTVSTAHLPQRIRVVTGLHSGNLQGIAMERVGDASHLWTTVDTGGGTARIDEYDLTGRRLRSSPDLPLGHAAGIAVAANGELAVVNGGAAAPTVVRFVDPATWTVVRTFDLSSLGPNGLIAAAPGGGWYVFAGVSGAYTVTKVAADGTVGIGVPVADEGVPQGLQVVHGELWLFTSLPVGNRITRFDAGSGAVLGTIALAIHGEGEGMTLDPVTGRVYVACHSPNRLGVLESVVVR